VVVYASTSLALAAIETFVNLDPRLRPPDLVSIEGEIPEALVISQIDAKSLPRNWYKTRDDSLRKVGDEWLSAGETVALMVPSAPIPSEWNVLLNPAHHDFQQITFHKPVRFQFDPRMFR